MSNHVSTAVFTGEDDIEDGYLEYLNAVQDEYVHRISIHLIQSGFHLRLHATRPIRSDGWRALLRHYRRQDLSWR